MFNNQLHKELLLNYKTYLKIYLKFPNINSVLIENEKYIDNSEMVDQLAKSTPFIIEKEKKKINKYDLSYAYFLKNKDYPSSVKQKINELGNKKYYIQKDKNIFFIFGKVYDKGYVLITKYYNEEEIIQDNIETFFLTSLSFFGINIFAFLYYLNGIKSNKRILENTIQEFEYLKEDTQKMAFEDTLTKAGTRLKFNATLKNLMQIASRFEQNYFGVIMLDIDNFKHINDTLGHDYGDYVLKSISSLIKKNIRGSDTFARWGGEEFVILAPMNNLKQSIDLAEKIRKKISELDFYELGKVTCSFGVGMYENEKNQDELMKKVDNLLYKAKKNGKNRVES